MLDDHTKLNDLLNTWKRGQTNQNELVSKFIEKLEEGQRTQGGDELTLLIALLKKPFYGDLPISYEFSHQPSKNDLRDLMGVTGIGSLYEKFHKIGITSDILWDLTDDILENELHLTGVERLKYKSAKAKIQKI